MPGRIFLTGGSGFVGSAVIDELLTRGYQVNALVHRASLAYPEDRVRSVRGDLFAPKALEEGLRDCTAVIHLVGIIREQPHQGITFERIHYQGTQAVVDAARQVGVRRYVHMSALGTRPDAVSQYHKTKYIAEKYVRGSGLDWTIFRPSLIHGFGGELMQMEAMWARKKSPPPVYFMPFMPYFSGKHAERIQPVYVKDVARAFVDALEKPQTIGQVYPLGGPDTMTWPEFHQICAQAIVGQRRMLAPIPAGIAEALATVGIGNLLGFNRDQVIMSQEDNTADMTKFTEDFQWTPQPFEASLRRYADQL
ncbi:MAG: complex I NDUFA9 subunit family protein [Bacillota bacterium]